MLWNWYTIDACFLAESWHITSRGMFAASCVGIVFLVVCLEFMRRLGKEHDAYLLRQFQRNLHSRKSIAATSEDCCSSPVALDPEYVIFRATPLQQLIRAIIHGVTLGLAYIVMLLAMYYNGYIIICIFIGAFLGYFAFGWESFAVGLGGSDRLEEEVTVCCG